MRRDCARAGLKLGNECVNIPLHIGQLAQSPFGYAPFSTLRYALHVFGGGLSSDRVC